MTRMCGGSAKRGSTAPPRYLATSIWERAAQAHPDGAVDFPEWLDAYRREAPLGQGGMGVVYRYRDTWLDRLVAVKTIPVAATITVERRQRFEREARALAALDHSNIGRIHQLLEHDGRVYLVLEYVPGRTLQQVLHEGPLEVTRALDLAVQVARAIEAGHDRRIVHRDIKPGNIMVTPGSVAKLLDYGLAWYHPEAATHDAVPGPAGRRADGSSPAPEPEPTPEPRKPRAGSDSDTTLPMRQTQPHDAAPAATGVGRVMGTAGYMSPEQARGEASDERTDVWAFGCVLFECLTGRPAFVGAGRTDRIRASLHAAPNLDLIPDDAPPAVRSLIERCLEKDSTRRTVRMGDVADELAALRQRLQPGGRGHGPVPHNLPEELKAFVGRQYELAEVHNLLQSTRLLTVIGAGGAGKTTLAVRAGRMQIDPRARSGEVPFPDGVFFAELGAITSPGRVAQAVLGVLPGGNAPEATQDRTVLSAVAEVMMARHALVILDNCEHVLGGCAAVAGALLRQCPHVSILATSRTPLQVDGEQLFNIEGLSFPRAESTVAETDECDAVRMFATCARRVRSRFEITSGNRAAVAEICRQLEGIPLAIELAAARISSLPVSDLAERLPQLIDPARVMESSVEWSVRLLTPPARKLLGRLGVFRGGWTLEAVERVGADSDQREIDGVAVIDLLTQLVANSLVEYEERFDRARYHLLESVGRYAREHLMDDDERARLQAAHADHYRALVGRASAEFHGHEQAAWFDRIDTEHENIGLALEHMLASDDVDAASETCAQIDLFWYVRGHADDARAFLDRAIARREGRADVLQMRTLNASGVIAERQGDPARAMGQYRAALEIARALDDRQRMAGLLTNLGNSQCLTEDLEAACRSHEEAIELYHALGDERGAARAQLNMAHVLVTRGDVEAARASLESCTRVFRADGDALRIAAAELNLARCAERAGAFPIAVEHARASLNAALQVGGRKSTAEATLRLGVALERVGDDGRAIRLLVGAEAMYESIAWSMLPHDRREWERSMSSLGDRLGRDALVQARGEASSVSFTAVADAAAQIADDTELEGTA